MMPVVQAINNAARKVPAWPLYVLAPLPVAWWFYLGMTGGLGAEPINALEREIGALALKVLIAVLCVTPLRIYLNLNLIKFRRALGLIAFFYVSLHLAVWAFLDVQLLGMIWADIVKRPYITVGMAGFVLLVPLAITSNNLSIRKMGPVKWRRLHKMTYLAILLGGMHFVMLAKVWEAESLIYLGVILALLSLRLIPARRRTLA